MINYLNKATKTISNYFKYNEDEINSSATNIEDNLIYLNSQLVLWKEDLNHSDDSFNQLFSFRFNNKFLVYNLTRRKIDFKTNLDKVVDFSPPDTPSYTLEFILTFAISAKNWLSLDSYNILLIHDDLKSPKVLALICTMLSYMNKSLMHPMDIYANIISTNPSFAELCDISKYKNITRYINYFSMIQNNPMVDYKQLYLNTVIINAAPAIDNSANLAKGSSYITINDKSFYSPVIRIISNGKVIYCSYKKNQPVEPITYSKDNCVKFECKVHIFGDTAIEVLHKQEDKFKQLFLIHFNTFFIPNAGMRFNKNQIDGICKDIRYPNEFFVDLILDEEQARPLSNYEEDVSKWKAILSEFILKGYKQNDISSSDGGVDMKLKENPRNKDIPSDDVSNMTSISSYDLEKDEDFSNKPSTLLTAHEILQKFNRAESHSNQDTSKGGEDEEENEEEDIEEYLKSLENKTN